MAGARGNEEHLLPEALTVVKGGVPDMPNGAIAHADTALLHRWQYTPNHVIGDVVRAYAAGIVGARTRLIQLLTWQQEHGHQTVCDAAGVAYRQSEQASTIYSASHWGMYMAAAWVHASRTGDTEVLDLLARWWRGMIALWLLFELPPPDGRVMVVAPRTTDPFDPHAEAILALLRGQRPKIRYKTASGDVTASRPSWCVWAVERLMGDTRWTTEVWPVSTSSVWDLHWERYIPRLAHPIWANGEQRMALDLPRTSPGRVSRRTITQSGEPWWSEEPLREYPPGGVLYGAGPETGAGTGGRAGDSGHRGTDTPPTRSPGPRRTLPDDDETARLSALLPSLVYGTARFGWHLDASVNSAGVVRYAIDAARDGRWEALDTLRALR